MLNRRMMALIFLISATFGALWWFWDTAPGMSLQAGRETVSSERYSQDLGGAWRKYPSLRQAWATESQTGEVKASKYAFTGGREIMLPSSDTFQVAARKFRIPAEWSARTMELVLSGVQGHATVYLNGVDSAHRLGEFEGGGTNRLAIPASAFLYGQDNVLIVELSSSLGQSETVLGTAWPEQGQLTGQIYLEAEVATVLANPRVETVWDGTTAQVTVKADLIHHDFLDDGPWTVNAVLSDGSAEVGKKAVVLYPDENVTQEVSWQFTVPEARKWSPEDPFLYQLYLTVANSKGDYDDIALGVGLRTVADVNGKIQLNGHDVLIKGVALSPELEQYYRSTGEVEQYLKEKRQEGINLVYFIGQFPDESWLQAADRVGMGVWAEWPVAMVPAGRLPQPSRYQSLAEEGKKHPSLWAWTVGKGLGYDNFAQTQNYLEEAGRAAAPLPVFAVQPVKPKAASLPGEIIIREEKLAGAWGEVSLAEKTEDGVQGNWQVRDLAAGIWAGVMLLLAWMNVRSIGWRYKEIGEKKPKRKLRKAWFWHGLAIIGRVGTLAGIVTDMIFHAPTGIGDWVPHLWPAVEIIQAQSPWLIWAGLTLLLTLIRLLQLGIAAPHQPESPHPLGLAYWLERRYRWAVLPALLWALEPWGVPLVASLAAYLGFSILFLPVRIRDIHRVGGRYKPFMAVHGVLVAVIAAWGLFRMEDWAYLWQVLGQSGYIMK